MSKDQKKTVVLPLEIVENWERMCDYCSSSLMFWKLEDKWPTNLIYYGLTDILSEIKDNLQTRSSCDT